MDEEEEQASRTGVIKGDTEKDNRRMELEYRIQELLGLSAEDLEPGDEGAGLPRLGSFGLSWLGFSRNKIKDCD